jgi:peptidoglycan/LPS O-acetylase OafA/YrhL
VAAIVVSAVSASLFISPDSLLYLSIVRFLHFFLVGFLLADIYLVDWREHPVRHWRWDLITLAGWPALVILWNLGAPSRVITGIAADPVIAGLGFPLLALFLYQAVFRGPLTNRVMTNPWITTVGGMCYTVYLFHNPMLGVFVGLTRGVVPTPYYTANVLIQGLMTVPAMLVCAGLYFVAIERPCMRRDWPQRAARWLRSAPVRILAGGTRGPMSDRV